MEIMSRRCKVGCLQLGYDTPLGLRVRVLTEHGPGGMAPGVITQAEASARRSKTWVSVRTGRDNGRTEGAAIRLAPSNRDIQAQAGPCSFPMSTGASSRAQIAPSSNNFKDVPPTMQLLSNPISSGHITAPNPRTPLLLCICI